MIITGTCRGNRGYRNLILKIIDFRVTWPIGRKSRKCLKLIARSGRFPGATDFTWELG